MLKKQSVSFYTAFASALCALLGLILFFVTDDTMGYAVQDGTSAVICTLIALLACGASLFLQLKNVSELFVTYLRVIAMGLMMAALTITLADRAVVAGGLFTWNSLDVHAWNAFYTGIACIVFQALSAILLVISGCLKQSKQA